ncbi:hypothetical protein QR98_0068620 [Sarcoptes scabiei]|uniref:Uncharacterized protein n=1 Tax=Sarcoptes scabiei TaxID=52283 RepID=A0A132ABI3_SARSC|nr:hypothetical protein QR98_0068620 [Sarcoptes scabiei]
MLKYAQAFGTDSSFQSYQALLKALAQSSASGSSSSPISIQQSQSMLSNPNPPISNKLFSSFFPSSASSSSSSASPQFSSNAWMTLPTSWAPSSLISILKPSHTPLGSRRSSFSNRLRNIMNALFYRLT